MHQQFMTDSHCTVGPSGHFVAEYREMGLKPIEYVSISAILCHDRLTVN